jgi:putative protease
MQTMVGKVIHYYPKIGVAAVVLMNRLTQGDRIRVHGPYEDFYQSVTSMELEHTPITEAEEGLDVGIRVEFPVHSGDLICRES